MKSIDTDVGIEYADEAPWRSYQLYATGSTYEELVADAVISEVDQDGGELNTYSLEDAPNAVIDAAMAILEQLVTA